MYAIICFPPNIRDSELSRLERVCFFFSPNCPYGIKLNQTPRAILRMTDSGYLPVVIYEEYVDEHPADERPGDERSGADDHPGDERSGAERSGAEHSDERPGGDKQIDPPRE